jgi:hypothetical protein
MQEFHKSELVSDLRPCSAVCTTLWKTVRTMHPIVTRATRTRTYLSAGNLPHDSHFSPWHRSFLEC